VGKQHADHLRNDLLKTYELTRDWAETVYSSITLKWDYKNRTCDISMPGYVSKVLSKFQHDVPKHPQHTPSRYVTPIYGAKTQYATKDETPPLTAQKCLTIQKVTRSVLYYTRAVEPTVLMPLNDIATEQTKVTEKHRPSPVNCYIFKLLTQTQPSDITPSTTWLPPQLNQKLERAFTTPKVVPHSESHSLNWATSNRRRLSAHITPLNSDS
jgi:hypothetical protein